MLRLYFYRLYDYIFVLIPVRRYSHELRKELSSLIDVYVVLCKPKAKNYWKLEKGALQLWPNILLIWYQHLISNLRYTLSNLMPFRILLFIIFIPCENLVLYIDDGKISFFDVFVKVWNNFVRYILCWLSVMLRRLMELQFFKGTNPLICQWISFVNGVYAIMTAIPIKKKCFLYYMFPLSLSNFFVDLLGKTIIIIWISGNLYYIN